MGFFFVNFCLTNIKVKDNVKFVRGVAMNCGLGTISQLAFYEIVKMLICTTLVEAYVVSWPACTKMTCKYRGVYLMRFTLYLFLGFFVAGLCFCLTNAKYVEKFIRGVAVVIVAVEHEL